MKTTELFAGTKSFSKVAQSLGFATETYDNDPALDPDHCGDIRQVSEIAHADVLWASPPCQGFSVAVIGRNWNFDKTPKTDSARLAMELAKKAIALIEQSDPKWWFIENPRGMLRKMPFMEELLKARGGGATYYHLLPVW